VSKKVLPPRGTAVETSAAGLQLAEQVPILKTIFKHVKYSVLIACTLSMAACSPAGRSLDIPFVARWNGEPVSCSGGPVALTDLRFFVSDVRLGEGDGTPAALQNDGRWQSDRVALIDLEDGQAACRNGSPDMQPVLRLNVSGNPGPGLRFSIGVPEDLNHANPLTAEPPLNYSVMHWHWLSGYKFMRAGIETPDDGFWVHLGSTACSGTIGNIEGCRQPNRPTIHIADFDAGADAVVVDLGRLFAGIDLRDSAATRCMSGPGEDACAPVYEALGLGDAGGIAGVFRRSAR